MYQMTKLWIIAFTVVFGIAQAGHAGLVLVNEYNATADDKLLDGGNSVDPFFGPVLGNGGDWFELVVTVDGIDMRGWTIDITEDGADDATLVFSQDNLWSNLRAGTIITIAEGVADDTSYDPDNGDWTLNVQAANGGTGTFITASDFATSNSDTQIRIRDDRGAIIFGPSGEGVAPASGVGSDEIFRLELDPQFGIPSDSGDFDDGNESTFAAPNFWSGNTQDFSVLRAGVVAPDADADGVFDTQDNCELISNADQRDTNNDGFGNLCDPDLNNDGLVDTADSDLLLALIGSQDPDADLNGDGIVDNADATILQAFLQLPPGPGVQLPPPPPPDLSDLVFDPNHVLDIKIDLPPDSWNSLLAEKRTITSILGGDCMAQPFAGPYNWYEGTVTIDGTVLPNTGVRKKGFLGSQSFSRPGLKLDLSRFVGTQSYNSVTRMTLNNAKQDPAIIRQCLGYQLFAQAGIPSSRCNFANVTVNGVNMGVFVNVEEIKLPMLARHFNDTSGNLYEVTASDFDPAWVNTFERKTNEGDLDRSDLDAVVNALQGPNADLVTDLSAAIDMDNFLTYWALEILLGSYDGFTSNRNNTYIYADPDTGKFVFVPWGIDGILAAGKPLGATLDDPPKTVFTYSRLPFRLYQEGTQLFGLTNKFFALLGTVWNEAAIHAEIDRMVALIQPFTGDLSGPIADLRAFVDGRTGQLFQELESGFPALAEEPSAPICLVQAGDFRSQYVTEWGGLGTQAPFAAGFHGPLGNVPFPINAVQTGTLSGPLANPKIGQIQFWWEDPAPDTFFLVETTFDPAAVQTNATLPVDGQVVDSVVWLLDSNGFQPLGYLDGGSLRFGLADPTPGGAVWGVLDSPFWVIPARQTIPLP